MDLKEISKGCKERGLDELFEFLEPFAKNAIKIDTQAKDDGDIAVGASKFGGQPDLPASVPWPSNENGALSFVAQINFAEVSKFDDETVLIELDGADAALLIGKEGYRYKAISYMLYNWLNSKYNLAIRLEIAQFLQNQEAMMDQYLNGVIERVQNSGRAQTKPLDGVLVKIALEKLREKFPDKYVGIKSGNDGKFVVVNDFFKK